MSQIPSSPGPALSMADQLGPEEPFEWDIINMEEPAPDVPIDPRGSSDQNLLHKVRNQD